MSVRPPKELTDEELSQELYNCAAFLSTQCEAEENESDDEMNLELVALLLLRAKDIVIELAGGESLEALATKSTAEDRKVLDGTAAVTPSVEEEPPA